MKTAILATLAFACIGGASEARDRSIPAQFRHLHPCPATAGDEFKAAFGSYNYPIRPAP